jgi:UPF0755 protein
MTEPPQRRGGRRRLREPEDEQPRSRFAAAPRDTEAQQLPPRGRHAQPELPAEGRRRLRPPERLRPVDEDVDPQVTRAAPERAVRARHGLDDAAEHAPPPVRRRRPQAPPEPPPGRRYPQPGDRSIGMPTAITEPTRRTHRVEPPTDVLPAQAPPPPPPPPPPAPPRRDEPVEEEFFGEDEYEEYDGDYDEYDYEDEEYDDAEYDYEDEEVAEEEPKKPRRKRGKRFFGWVAALAVLGLLAGGAWYGFNALFGYDDYEGAGTTDVLFQVDDGDTTSAIGAKLASAGIVASGKAFVKASEDNPAVTKLQHGFYVLKEHMSGAAAVQKITAQDSRVGQLEIRAYTQFDDITQPDGKVTPGVYSLLSKATCAELNGKSTCVSVEDLKAAAANADLRQLGVPDWAIADASKADKGRRLEGLIAPGVYDVKPGSNANDVLGQLVKSSAEAIQAAGLNGQTSGPGVTPYQTLIVASLIEREAVKVDFGKISRVIYNRLQKDMRLQLDSTVNYVLDRPTLATSDEDRAKPGPYNTYKNTGLPPTPISVPSAEAIKAALNPEPGDYLFFVKCETDGQSCFANNIDDHNKNVAQARAKGVI